MIHIINTKVISLRISSIKIRKRIHKNYLYIRITLNYSCQIMIAVKEFASSLSSETKWHGNHNENSNQVNLKAGALSMIYENGNLRRISLGNYEIIRMIYPAVRDPFWLTIPTVISEEEIITHRDSFIINYLCNYEFKDIKFRARTKIEGFSDSSLIFSYNGEALNTFEKNRIGFCVLHPVEECAGEDCKITHTDGKKETLKFPGWISPHQPFFDIKSMSWNIEGQNCIFDFFGEIFETEDQRNWTDASFKTYCTPLHLPRPMRVDIGDIVSQRVHLRIESTRVAEAVNDSLITITTDTEHSTSFPALGIGQSTRSQPLTGAEISILKDLHFDHYRVELYLFDSNWKTKAESASDEAELLGYNLEFVLFFDDNANVQCFDFIGWLDFKQIKPGSITILHKTSEATPDFLTEIVAPHFKKAFPDVLIGAGTNSNFTQLNRNKPSSKQIDYICYSVHPQEHASDNLTLVENLKGQQYTVESAMHISNGKCIRISPVNIQRRFNANIENYEAHTETIFPYQVDSRLMSLFGAMWTIGSFKYLAEAGSDGVTYFEIVGERGIMQGDADSRWPDEFPSIKKMLFPVFSAFKYLLTIKHFKVLKCESSNPLKVDALILSERENTRIILMNFTDIQQTVCIKGFYGKFTLKQLSDETFEDAVSNANWIDNTKKTEINLTENISLRPFSLSFVEELLQL